MAKTRTYGQFRRGDTVRVAYSPAEAVRFRFEGWEELQAAAGAVPPRAGRGSSRDHWADYAAENGVEVTEEMTRDDIVTALVAAGVPTEAGGEA